MAAHDRQDAIIECAPDELTHGDPLGLGGALHLSAEASRCGGGDAVGVSAAAII